MLGGKAKAHSLFPMRKNYNKNVVKKGEITFNRQFIKHFNIIKFSFYIAITEFFSRDLQFILETFLKRQVFDP